MPQRRWYYDDRQRYALKLVTAPSEEPVSVSEAKSQLRLDGSDQDTYIGTLITAARRTIERITNRALVTQTWDLVLDEFPLGDTLEVPYPPLQSITSITYTDDDGTSYTFAASNYIVDVYSEPGRVVLKTNATWPSDDLQAAAGVVVQFVAGEGDADDVRQEHKQAIQLLMAHFYEHAEAVSEIRNLEELPLGVQMLLSLDRMIPV